MMFIALTIVSCLRMVGIVLAISLLTLPQMTANLFTHSFKRIIWLSIAIGYIAAWEDWSFLINYKFLQEPPSYFSLFWCMHFAKWGKAFIFADIPDK